MAYPVLSTTAKKAASTTQVTDVFNGYNHNIRIQDSEMFDTENLTADYYPLLASRKLRALKKTMTAPGGLLEKDALCYVDNGTLYVNHNPTAVTGLSAGEKRMVSMGAYVLIFPDKVYYNTEDPTDTGMMEASYSATGSIGYAPCSIDGEEYAYTASSAEPENPQNGDYWIDTGSNTLQQFSGSQGIWTAIPTVYTKIKFPSQGSLPLLFKAGDVADIQGTAHDELNGSKYLYAVGGESETTDDYIVVVGLITSSAAVEGTVSLSRTLPDMDFVIECQNRLWGCKYGPVDGQIINELYCSALGDFKNWRVYQGLSTDSWAASVGSDGQWTGAVNYLGRPVFFKENRIHVITISTSGAHRVDETICRGVQKGSHKSLKVVGETLYYKSRSDVCAWQGGFPSGVSGQLGDMRYYNAVAGTFGSKYYLSMMDVNEVWHLFTYDTNRGIWIREDNLHAVSFAAVDDELWCLDAEKHLIAINGTEGEKEEPVSWMMESGILHYTYPNRKYVSRYDISLSMEHGSKVKVFLQYNSSGPYEQYGQIEQTGTGAKTIPIRPRRCDHLKMRLTGVGDVKIFAISRKLEVGSDV